MDNTIATAPAVSLSSPSTFAPPTQGTSGLWLMLSAPISLALTLAVVVYLAKLSF